MTENEINVSEKHYGLAFVASVLSSSRQAVEDYSMEIGPSAIAPVILAARELKRRATLLESWLEDRYQRECEGQLYEDPDGVRWVMRADREWRCNDPMAMYEGLRRLPMDGQQRGLLIAAFKSKPAHMEVDHGLLNQMAARSREAAAVIRDWRTRVYGPAHLVRLEENTK